MVVCAQADAFHKASSYLDLLHAFPK